MLFGRGFTQQQAETLYASCKDATKEAERKVGPVLWAAGAEAHRKSGKVGAEPPPNVAKIVVPIFRGLLEDWKKRVESGVGEVGEGKEEGVVLY